ncbi:laccase [Lactarius pseudohatsudake]|nr:laccase [Lactarius pseudohatsudake]
MPYKMPHPGLFSAVVVVLFVVPFVSVAMPQLELRSLLLFAAVFGGVSASIGPGATLKIVNDNISPDGFPRAVTLAGGTFPGPLIVGEKDAEFSIKVADKLEDKTMNLATSIHWHGLFQKHTNYVDGPSFVTQCPIIPDHSFLYDFKALDQAGTYWYHSHFKTQYCDGLRGPLVVYDPNDPHLHLYDIDDESTIITLADWYHYLSTEAPAIPAFNSTLINGKGRYPGGPEVPLAVVDVKHGKRSVFFTGSALYPSPATPNFVFSIDGHQLTVIEADGIETKPLVVDSLQIFAGQRYSVVLNANQPVANYWIRSLPPGLGFGNFTNLAILRYDGASQADPKVDPTVPVVSKLPLVETNLHPLDCSPVPGKAYPGGADININLDVEIILSGAKSASQLLPAKSIYSLAPNKSVELTIPGGAVGGPHPVHLHGHAFSVAGDNVTIRFFTDNPGPWFFHCHIDWHLEAGFAVVFAEDVPDVPRQDIRTCELFTIASVRVAQEFGIGSCLG